MDSPGYILLSRLTLQERSTQALSHNLANADTPGFEARDIDFKAALTAARGEGAAARPGGLAAA
jgi:flagellar basal-body rod protein FlgB